MATYSLNKDGNKNLSAHFTVREFKCKDGSDKIIINPELITVLEKLYNKLGAYAINITSGYRTPTHSVKVGGYATDQHTKGNAADITVKKSKDKYYTSKEICLALEDLNHNGGIGLINNNCSVHVDVRGKKCWFDETKNEKIVNSWYAYFGVKKPVKGDVDGDGKVTAKDARTILRVAGGLETLKGQAATNADMDSDGKITAKDAREALRKSANLD